jgi:hypothetical protein
MGDIKDKVLELAEISKACPENLQAICFEALVKHYLAGLPAEEQSRAEQDRLKPGAQVKPEEAVAALQETAKKQEDLKETDLHVKLKRFMEKQGLSLDDLNNLFYKEDDRVLPLYEDLKTTRMAEGQMRITMLRALVTAMSSGEFEVDVEAVRRECVERKCYDGANFAANFRNNRSLFDFAKFDRNTKKVRLSDSGKKELGNLLKELR